MLIHTATTIVTDVGLLGLSSDEANRRAFELDEPVRSAVLIADRMRRAQLGNEMPNGCEDAIARVCDVAGYDLATLVAAVADTPAELWSGTMCWFPWDVLNDTSRVGLPVGALPDLADSHLHSGAAIDLRGFCRVLVGASRETPDVPAEIWSHDARGTRFSLKVVVHAVRHFLQHAADDDPQRRAGRRFHRAIVTGQYWWAVRAAALDPTANEPFIQDLWVNDGPAHADRGAAFTKDLVLTLKPDSVPFVAALALVSHSLRSHDAEGLRRFVDRFDQMGLLRDTALNEARADVVAESCRHVLGHDSVIAAEFRKTIVPQRGAAGSSEKLRRSIKDHLSGFLAFAEGHVRAPRLSMPVTFGREMPNGVPAPDELVTCYRLRSLWSVYATLIEFRRDHPSTGGFLTGVDVVGYEMWTSNWPFVVLFQDMVSQPALDGVSRAAHAGEFFRWRMQGLRSIGELILPNCVVERIGHALALDQDVAPYMEAGEILFRDVVEDLCWLHAAGVERATVDNLLDRVTHETRLALYGIGPSELLHAWASRRSLSGLADEGLVGGDVRSSTDWPAETIPASQFELSPPHRRALLALVYRGSGPLNLLDSDAGQLGHDYLAWSDGVCSSVADLLAGAMVKSGVVVECCPTSNVSLSHMTSIGDHPIGRFVDDRKLLVSLNSDDPLIFGSSIAGEALQVQAYFGDDVLQSVSATSVATCCPTAPLLDGAGRAALAEALRIELGVS